MAAMQEGLQFRPPAFSANNLKFNIWCMPMAEGWFHIQFHKLRYFQPKFDMLTRSFMAAVEDMADSSVAWSTTSILIVVEQKKIRKELDMRMAN